MTLTIRDDTRDEIQKDVDALTQHPYYFNMKLERAKTYFPLIEVIFKEERLPDDFKYLALQESALISDAVSSSNAVVFWQFKDFTAEEMGMRVDKDVDERMNLISATRGAAKYLKQNNFYFNNWVYALQAYQMGAGGAMRAVGDKHNGAKHMEIDKDTYWYVKKYLAHKIAFENALAGEAQLKLAAYETSTKTSLKDIASELYIDLETLEEYNKWAKRGIIPDDKIYTVLVPSGTYDKNFTKLEIAAASKPDMIETVEPVMQSNAIFVNGIPAILAKPGERMIDLADGGGISLSAFLKYNDLNIDHTIITGGTYFLDRKKSKAEEPYHKVADGEDLWMISQAYGIKLKKLKKYNRLVENQKIKPNEMLWLSKTKPQSEEVPVDGTTVELDASEEFNWGISTNDSQTLIEYKTQLSPSESWGTFDEKGGLELGAKNDGYALDATITSPLDQKAYYHEVKPSDTLYSVARQYGVTIKDLMLWNQKKDFDLSIGEKLKILQP
ncbi:MAG TPA: LysM peptidoglycan-binding domain-containing protein [Cyclobacteriaceae bacterium]